jgi:YidC/Oxa1 family membrane protein insertase
MDFKKTILWAVFSLSGLMLYNNWQVHEGKPSMFGGASHVASTSNPAGTTKIDTPAAISGPPASQIPGAKPAAVENTQLYTLENDLISLEVSSAGANVVQAKLLKELTADEKPVEIFRHTPTHTYVARSGLVAMGNSDLPNHTSTFKLDKSGKDGSGRPFLVLSSERGGVKLEKLSFSILAAMTFMLGIALRNFLQMAHL